MTITKDEKVLKRWEYATVKRRKRKTNYTLTVTNKRIVYEEKNALQREREEIPIKAVKAVSIFKQNSSREKALRALSVIFLIFGAIVTALGLALLVVALVNKTSISDSIPFLIMGVIYFIVALIFNFCASRAKVKINFSLRLTTYGVEGEPMGVGMIASFRRLFKSAMAGIVKIKVSDSVTEEIFETIGALIVDNR